MRLWQRPAASVTILRVITGVALACTAVILLVIARRHELSSAVTSQAAGDTLREDSTSLGVTKEKLAILEGAKAELETVPERHEEGVDDADAEGSGDDGRASADAIILQENAAEGDVEFQRMEETNDVLDLAGEALGGESTYVTPFPEFNGDPRVYTYKVAQKYKHDHTAFTQGLVYADPDTLYESTGSVGGASSIREVSLVSGMVRQKKELGKEHFAEGLTMHNGRLAQITWRSNRGFYYDPATLELDGEFRTPLEDGWGLTNDTASDAMVATDASHNLHFLSGDGGDLALVRSTAVTDHGKPIRFANELETVGNELWANVLERDCIARIDPTNGVVVGWILLKGLKDRQDPVADGMPRRDSVLNGIAYDAQKDRVFVTGKMWRNVFEIRLREVDQASELNRARQECWPAESLPEYGYP